MTQENKRKASEWLLIAGLGNPGKEYENTYHNIGERALEGIVASLGGVFSEWTGKPFYYAKIGNRIFIKPKTYMNESGQAVKSAAKHFGINPDQIAIIQDDSDLPIGSYKVDFDRGSAGHNGIKSIINELKTMAFSRIRIGVRDELNKKAGDFVLNKIPAAQKIELDKVLLDIQRSYFER